MERFDGPEGHKAFQSQIEAELHDLRFSPARKRHIVALASRRRISFLERVQAILDYEITLTLPQLGAGVAAAAIVLGLYWGQLLWVDEAAQARYQPPTVVYMMHGESVDM